MFERIDIDAKGRGAGLAGLRDRSGLGGSHGLGLLNASVAPAFRLRRRAKAEIKRVVAQGLCPMFGEIGSDGIERGRRIPVRKCLTFLRRDGAGLGRTRGDGLGRGQVGGGEFAFCQFGERAQFADQHLVAAGGLFALIGKLGEDVLDPVHRLEDRGDGDRVDVGAVAESADHRFRRMGQRLQPGQADEAARALDGVHQPEDAVQDISVVGLAFEAHELAINRFEVLSGLGQELLQQFVHARTNHSTQQRKPDLNRRTVYDRLREPGETSLKPRRTPISAR